MEVIHLDVLRTFPTLGFFQEVGSVGGEGGWRKGEGGGGKGRGGGGGRGGRSSVEVIH